MKPWATLGEPVGILHFSHIVREKQMPAQRLAMRQVHEVLRLKWGQGLSDRQIAHSLGMSRPAVAEYVRLYRIWCDGMMPMGETAANVLSCWA